MEVHVSQKILIVDDDIPLAQVLTIELISHGYEVVVAHDAYQGVKQAHDFHPDLIILDLKMPGGGGITAFKNISLSVQTSTIPIIFVSSYSQEEAARMVGNMEAKDFCKKPFKMDDILLKIKKVLE